MSDAEAIAPEVVAATMPAVERGLASRIMVGTLNYGLGKVLPQLISFLLLPLYTSILTPKDYGGLDLAVTFGGLLVLVMRLGVPGAVTRFYFDHREGEDLGDYVTTTGWFLILCSLGVGALVLVSAPHVIPTALPGLPVYYVALVVIASIMASNSDLQRRLIQAREQSGYSAKLSAAMALSEIGLTVVLVAGLRWGAVGVLTSQATVACVFFFQALRYLRRDLRGRYRPEMLGRSLRYAVGILPSHVMSALIPLLSRGILAHMQSTAEVGLFGVANRLIQPLWVLALAFNEAYIPIYFSVRAKAGGDGLHRLAAAERAICLFAMFGALGATVVGPPVLLLMTPAAYARSAQLLPILALYFLARVLYVLLSSELFFEKRTWPVPLVTASQLGVNLLVALLMTRRYGAVGTAWAAVAGQATAALVAGLFRRRTVSLPHDWLSLLRPVVVASAIAAAVLAMPLTNVWERAAGGLAGVFAFVVLLWLLRDPVLRGLFARRAPKRGAG